MSKATFINFIVVYTKTFFMIPISLLTTRYVLINLGLVDYGIYNVLVGFVSLFSLLHSFISSSTMRYLTLHNSNKISEINYYNYSISFHLILSFLALFVSSTLGFIYINYFLVIPTDYDIKINVAFIFIVFFVSFNMIIYPLETNLISKSKFITVSLLSIFLSVIKFFSILMFSFVKLDQLFLFSLLNLFLTVIHIIFLLFLNSYNNSKYKFEVNFRIFIEYVKFSIWDFLGSISTGFIQNFYIIIVNYFFGPIINTAYSLATSFQRQLSILGSNFLLLIRNRMINNFSKLQSNLLFSYFYIKLSFFISSIVVIPLFLNTEVFLILWLNDFPFITTILIRILLISTLITSIHSPIGLVFYGVGSLKVVNLGGIFINFVGFITTVIITFFITDPIFIVFIPSIFIVILQIYEFIIAKKMISVSLSSYFLSVLKPIVLSLIFIFPIAYYLYVLNTFNNIIDLFIKGIILICVIIIINYIVIFNKNEKHVIKGLFSILILKR
jgi:hypothetical protein